MSYGFQRTVSETLEHAEEQIRERLAEQGFGILTEIDVQKAFQEKLGVNFRRYRILGACHPQLAHQALEAETEIGLLMPCNVVLWENDDQTTTVSIASAVSILKLTDADLSELAQDVDQRLQTALQSL